MSSSENNNGVASVAPETTPHLADTSFLYYTPFEIRALKNGDTPLSGFYTDPAIALAHARELNDAGWHIYSPYNPLRPDFPATNNIPRNESATKDADIARRVFIGYDIDTIRPEGLAATDEEKQKASALAMRVASEYAKHGVAPRIVDSGNGYQLCVPIDLSNDEESKVLVKRVLEAHARQFETPGAKLDVLFNASRIFRVPGFTNWKGDGSAARPHRVVKLMHEASGLASRDLLEEFAASVPKTTPFIITPPTGTAHDAVERGKEKVSKLLEDAGVDVQWAPASAPWVWKCDLPEDVCPNSANHTEANVSKTTFSLGIMKSGAIDPKCQHSGCADVRWDHVRALLVERGRGNVGTALETYVKTDSGNAQRLIAEYGKNFRYLTDENKWLYFDGRRWTRDQNAIFGETRNLTLDLFEEATRLARSDSDEDRAKAKAAFAFAQKSDSAFGRMNMVSMARYERGVAVKLEDFDQDPLLLNVQNGTLDLKTCTLREHRREDMLSRICPVAFDPIASCPRWLEFLEQTFPDRPEVGPFLQRSVGYSLTGLTSEQCFWLLIGFGRNGKSVLLNVIEYLLGDYAVATSFDTFMVKRKDAAISPRDGLASLRGARFVRASEAEAERKFNEATIKNLTGGEQVRTAEMYKADVSFRPTFKIFLSTNHDPVIEGTDDGIWRRIKRVNFEHQVAPEKVVPDLDKILEPEAPGILNWALAGLKDYQRGGLQEPVTVTSATHQYRHDQNPIREFLEDVVEPDPDGKLTSRELLDRFNQWAIAYRKPKLSQTAFGNAMRAAGYQQTRSGKAKVTTYIGLCWKGNRAGGPLVVSDHATVE